MSGGLLCYCIGGGLGHLTRTRAVLDQLGWSDRATLFTASLFADDERVTGGLPCVAVPRELGKDPATYRRWLLERFDELRPDAVLLDAFPAGVLGEFCDFPPLRGVEIHHVARLMRWRAYAPLIDGPIPRLAATYAVEPLHPDHQVVLRRASDRLEPLDLGDPPPLEPADSPAVLRARELAEGGSRPWLVIQSAPEPAVVALVKQADAVRRMEAPRATLLVATRTHPDGLPPGTELLDEYPVRRLFPLVGRIFSAAGFNAMRELRRSRDRHTFVPLRTKFDDQHERARRATRELRGAQ